MSKLDAAGYFHTLADLIRTTQVTDHQGTVLSLDQGTQRAIALLQPGVPAAAQPGGDTKVMLVGNGGSAAIVSHMQNDLSKAVGKRALVFNEPPLLTALTNDEGYEVAFARLVSMWAEPGDVLVAVSSSGQSRNILRAVDAARSRDCQVITFSGFRGDNPLRRLGDVNFYVASDAYGFVEVAHTALAHYLTDRAVWSIQDVGRGDG